MISVADAIALMSALAVGGASGLTFWRAVPAIQRALHRRRCFLCRDRARRLKVVYLRAAR